MNAPSKSTAVATAQPVKSVVLSMADRYGMDSRNFERTVRAICLPPDKKTGREATNEEFAAFLLVARQYSLNPLLKEIYGFMSQGGGIVPIVSIDGWMNLINSHPQMDGMVFSEVMDGVKLVSTTCTIYRKDRAKPTVVTEYYEECRRDTVPWKMKHRMLRHKSAIQCARYAFGFAGIYDEDEGEKIAQAAVALEPPAPPPPPPEIAPENDVIDTTYTEHAPPEPPAEAAHQAGDNAPSNLSPAATNPEDFDSEKIVSDFEAAVTGASESLLDDLRDDVFAKIEGMDMPRAFRTRIQNAYENALQKLQPPEPPANEQPEPPAPAPEPEPARQEVGDDGFPDTTPQESEDVQLAAVQKDHAAMVRQLARQKARKGISFWKRWKGGLKPDELEIVEAMVEYSDGTLQAWAKRADAARPKDDF